jgi:hypothetical protein
MSAIGMLVSVATSGALVVLFLLSVRFQFYSMPQLLRRRAPRLGVLGTFRLFAPRPVRTDIHLIARDCRPDGVPSSCREIPIIERRDWTHAVWNPGKRRSLPLLTLMLDVTAISTTLGEDRAAVVLSAPYLILLGMVSSRAAADAQATQYLLVERFGYEAEADTQVLFCSAVHRLDRSEIVSTSRSLG